MFGFLGFILIIILFIVLIALAVLGNIIRAIFGFGKRVPKHFYGNKTSTNQTESNYTSGNNTQQTTFSNQEKKKIFADNEGEYVDFEEVD